MTKKLAKVMKSEIDLIKLDNKYYDLEIKREAAWKFVSESFRKLMSTLLPIFNENLASLQIGNMLTTAIKRKLTQLQAHIGLLIKINVCFKYSVN